MANTNNNRRRTYIVKMDFQKDFIIKYCVLIIAAAVIISAIVYFMCGSTVTTIFKDSRLKILSTTDFILPYLVMSSLVAVICAGLTCWIMTLVISNRLAGPLYRFEQDIAKMAQGDLTLHFRVRQKDEFQSLVYILNDMTRVLRGDIGAVKSGIDEITRSEHLTAEGKRLVNGAKSVLEKYKV